MLYGNGYNQGFGFNYNFNSFNPFQATARMLAADHGITVIYGADKAKCDVEKKIIHLPAMANPSYDELTLARFFLDHETAHFVAESEHAIKERVDKFTGYVLNMLEDVRVEAVLAEEYLGCQMNFERGGMIISRKARQNMSRPDFDPDPLKQLAWSIYSMGKGNKHYPVWDKIMDDIVLEFKDEIETIHQWANSTADLVDLAERIVAKISDESKEQHEKQQQEKQQGEGKPGKEESPDGSGAPSQGKADPLGSSPRPMMDEIADKLDSADTDISARITKDMDDSAMEGYGEDNVIFTGEPYLPQVDMCTTLENCDDIDKVRWIYDKAQVMGGALRQTLRQMLVSSARTGYKGNRFRGEPDPNRLAALATGTDGRVFRKRIMEQAPTTMISLLVDGSGSMNDSVMYEDNPFHGNGKITRLMAAMVAATAFGLTLQDIFPCEIALFTQYEIDWSELGVDNHTTACERGLRLCGTELKFAKNEHENFMACLRRIPSACRNHCSNTPLGEALWVLRQKMAARDHSRKVVFAFTDGGSNAQCGMDGTKHVIEEMEKEGIEVIIIGIGDDYGKHLCDKHVRCEGMTMTQELMGQLKKYLFKE